MHVKQIGNSKLSVVPTVVCRSVLALWWTGSSGLPPFNLKTAVTLSAEQAAIKHRWMMIMCDCFPQIQSFCSKYFKNIFASITIIVPFTHSRQSKKIPTINEHFLKGHGRISKIASICSITLLASSRSPNFNKFIFCGACVCVCICCLNCPNCHWYPFKIICF